MDNDSTQPTAEPVEPAMTEEKPFPWAEVISSVWQQRKRIAMFVVAATVVATV